MSISADPTSRHRRIALIAGGLVLLTLVAVGGYGLLAGSANRSADPAPQDAAPPVATSPEPEASSRPGLTPIAETTDPETFARRVAHALFTWDTGAGLMPLDYTSVLLDVGDPSGAEQAGLAADIATYLPTRAAWMQLREYGTTQRLVIDNVIVPHAWRDAVAQAQPRQLPPGAIAFTIDGVRHRDGIWKDEPQALSKPTAFTLFLACPPEGKPCYLLRLSQLDRPLR